MLAYSPPTLVNVPSMLVGGLSTFVCVLLKMVGAPRMSEAPWMSEGRWMSVEGLMMVEGQMMMDKNPLTWVESPMQLVENQLKAEDYLIMMKAPLMV